MRLLFESPSSPHWRRTTPHGWRTRGLLDEPGRLDDPGRLDEPALLEEALAADEEAPPPELAAAEEDDDDDVDDVPHGPVHAAR